MSRRNLALNTSGENEALYCLCCKILGGIWPGKCHVESVR
jgi:hypothetical protein